MSGPAMDWELVTFGAMGCRTQLLSASSHVKIPVRFGRQESDTAGQPPYPRKRVLELELSPVTAIECPTALTFCGAAAWAVRSGQRLLVEPRIGVGLSGGDRHFVFDRQRHLLQERDRKGVALPTILEGQVFWCMNEGSSTWGHWLVHNLPRALLFLEHYPYGRIAVPHAYFSERLRNFGETLAAAGITSDRVVLVDRMADYQVERPVFLNNLYTSGVPHPKALEYLRGIRDLVLRKQAMDAVGRASENIKGGVFVERIAKNREIQNFADVRPILEEKGINIRQNGKLSVAEQVVLWNASEFVVGVTGSDLTNMALGNVARIFALTPRWFGDRFFFGLAAALGIEWNELSCSKIAEERKPKHRSSFVVDPEALARFLA